MILKIKAENTMISKNENCRDGFAGLGLGCWVIGGRDWGSQKDCDSIQAVKAAYASGIRHFDTAQSYGKGHSEELLGRTLHKIRDKCFIASKMMYTPPQNVEESVLQSLQRLQTDYLDLLYIHWPKKNVDLAAMMEQLVILREKGAIRRIGVSNFSIDQMKEVMKAGSIDACQICYNLLWRWPEHELIPYCKDNKIAVVTYSTIAQGILTGKFTSDPLLVPGDHRKSTVMFDKNVWPEVYAGVVELNKIAKAADVPLRELAIQWVMMRDGVAAALVGARNALQVKENIHALSTAMSADVYEQLTAVSDQLMSRIPDTGNIFRWYP